MRFEEIKDMKVAIYLRKSQHDIDREKRNAIFATVEDTLHKHRRELLDFAKEHRLQFTEDDIYSEVVSAEYILSRPQARKLIEAVRDEKYQGVVVIAPDRLTRGGKADQGLIEDAFKESGTLIITPSQVYDLDNEEDQFQLGFKNYISHLELNSITKRLQMGRVRSTREGKDVSSKPPYGYQKNSYMKLIPNPDEAQIVQEIFNRFVKGETMTEIANDLTRRGIPTPSDAEEWHLPSLRRILRREKYKGIQVFGERQTTRKSETGKYVLRKRINQNRFIKVQDTHEPLITAEDWSKAQILLDIAAKTYNRKRLSNPFKDVLICSKCGKPISVSRKKGQSAKYYCRTKNCPTSQIVEDRLIEHMINYVTIYIEEKRRRKEIGMDVGESIEIGEKVIKSLKSEDSYQDKNDLIKTLVTEIKYTKDPLWRRDYVELLPSYRF